jgi:hypothetical protein
MTANIKNGVYKTTGFDIEMPLPFSNGRHIIRLLNDKLTVETDYVSSPCDAQRVIVSWGIKYHINQKTRGKMFKKACRLVNEYNEHVTMPYSPIGE